MKNKQAQIWSLDLMAGMTLFLIGIVIFFIYSLNQPGEAEDNLELLFYEGKVTANSLVSSGFPEKWDSNSVITLGIADDGRINNTKLKSLHDMINAGNYTQTKNILNTRFDYYFFFENNMTSIDPNLDGIGKPGTTRNNVNAKNLIKTTRFTVYQNKTTPLYLYTWEE